MTYRAFVFCTCHRREVEHELDAETLAEAERECDGNDLLIGHAHASLSIADEDGDTVSEWSGVRWAKLKIARAA